MYATVLQLNDVAVLCCAVLCCAVLCCAVLCCAVLCCAVLCCAGGAKAMCFGCASFAAFSTAIEYFTGGM
jgi:hypothetical protein